MDSQQTLISHLLELRDKLLRSVIAWAIFFVALFSFRNELYSFLAQPLLSRLPQGSHMIATEVVTPFFVPVKVAMMAALLGALPYILYQLWSFIAPGLYAHEKKIILPLVVASLVLFACGMAFAYFMVFPVVFGFVIGAAPEGVEVMTDIDKYLDFVLTLFLAFGVTFEVPIVVVALTRMGIVEVSKFKEMRPYVIVGAFVVGAIFTPPDVISQTMLAIPLWLLYELGILVSTWLDKKQPPDTSEGEYRPMTDDEIESELNRDPS